jgi:Na+/melibiose symporter-like transporter
VPLKRALSATSHVGLVDALLRLRRQVHYKHLVLDKGRLSKRIRYTYGAPTLVHQTAAPTIIQLYALIFYEELGMTLAMQAAIMAVARSLDVITDPTMSYITENFQSKVCGRKRGRRRPFIVSGCWVYGIALVLLMTPGLGSDLSSGMLSLWFGCTYIFFFLTSTYCAIPYDALGPELTDNYDDCNELYMFSNLFSLAGTLIGAGLPIYMKGYVSSIDFVKLCVSDAEQIGSTNVSFQCPDVTFSTANGLGWNMTSVIGAGTNSSRVAGFSDYAGFDAEKHCRNTDRGPEYSETGYAKQFGLPLLSSTFPGGLCNCYNQCSTDSDLVAERWGLFASAAALGFYYCVTMCWSYAIITERGYYPVEDGDEADSKASEAKASEPDSKVASEASEAASQEASPQGSTPMRQKPTIHDAAAAMVNTASVNSSMPDAKSKDSAAKKRWAELRVAMRDAMTQMEEAHGEGKGSVQRRAKSTHAHKREPTPLVTGLLNTLNNKPFTQLLPAWMCDSMNVATITSLMMYYVQYVVAPEYSNGCIAGDPVDPDNTSYLYKQGMCQSDYVAAACLISILAAAISTLPLWQALARATGKRNAWLAWSAINAVTNVALISIGEDYDNRGDVWLLIWVAGLNGVPLGASFLSDSILSDIISYDELLTGKRNEATYTMFRSFLPKLCAIPAAVIPVSLLASTGYISPAYGVPQPPCESRGGAIGADTICAAGDLDCLSSCQPAATFLYLKYVFALVPLAFAILSFAIKTRFAMKTRKQVNEIGVGIAQHLLSKPAKCPFSGVSIFLTDYTENETYFVNLLGHFPGVWPIEMLLHGMGKEGEEQEESAGNGGDRRDGEAEGEGKEGEGKGEGGEEGKERGKKEVRGAGSGRVKMRKGKGEVRKTSTKVHNAEAGANTTRWGQGALRLVTLMSQQLAIAQATFGVALVSAITSGWFLMSSNISFIPVLLIVSTGVSVVALAFTTLRQKAAKTVAAEMETTGPHGIGNALGYGLTHTLLRKILKERRMLADVWECTKVSGPARG